jgi:hypothetical protein
LDQIGEEDIHTIVIYKSKIYLRCHNKNLSSTLNKKFQGDYNSVKKSECIMIGKNNISQGGNIVICPPKVYRDLLFICKEQKLYDSKLSKIIKIHPNLDFLFCGKETVTVTIKDALPNLKSFEIESYLNLEEEVFENPDVKEVFEKIKNILDDSNIKEQEKRNIMDKLLSIYPSLGLVDLIKKNDEKLYKSNSSLWNKYSTELLKKVLFMKLTCLIPNVVFPILKSIYPSFPSLNALEMFKVNKK